MQRQTGFTLIEIVFVIGVLGVLATFGFQSLSGSGSITDLVQAEDTIIAELRKARSRALHRLPPSNGSEAQAASLKEQVDRMNKRAGSSVEVDPKTVCFTVGDGNENSVKGVDCNGCKSCPDKQPDEYKISLMSTEKDSQTELCLNAKTGRVEREPCIE